jgi:hypothetical protein
MRTYDPMTTAISAVSNASTIPATTQSVVAALRTGQGEPSHLRALFGDVSFETLIRIGIQYGVSNREIGRAYQAARRQGARNLDLDAWCAEQLGPDDR